MKASLPDSIKADSSALESSSSKRSMSASDSSNSKKKRSTESTVVAILEKLVEREDGKCQKELIKNKNMLTVERNAREERVTTARVSLMQKESVDKEERLKLEKMEKKIAILKDLVASPGMDEDRRQAFKVKLANATDSYLELLE